MSAVNKLASASPEVRELALALMDDLSVPMTPREIEFALKAAGMTRSQARPIVKALKALPIVAIGSGDA